LILAGRLARLGAEVDADGHGSTVRIDDVSEKDLPGVLAVVEQWVDDEGVEEARVDIGESTYTMSG
jgi:hypothetical protein